MPDNPVNDVNLAKVGSSGSDELTHAQMLAELHELEEKICRYYEQINQMLAAYCEDLKQHSNFMQELRKDVLRWFEEREQRFAQSPNSNVD